MYGRRGAELKSWPRLQSPLWATSPSPPRGGCPAAGDAAYVAPRPRAPLRAFLHQASGDNSAGGSLAGAPTGLTPRAHFQPTRLYRPRLASNPTRQGPPLRPPGPRPAPLPHRDWNQTPAPLFLAPSAWILVLPMRSLATSSSFSHTHLPEDSPPSPPGHPGHLEPVRPASPKPSVGGCRCARGLAPGGSFRGHSAGGRVEGGLYAGDPRGPRPQRSLPDPLAGGARRPGVSDPPRADSHCGPPPLSRRLDKCGVSEQTVYFKQWPTFIPGRPTLGLPFSAFLNLTAWLDPGWTLCNKHFLPECAVGLEAEVPGRAGPLATTNPTSGCPAPELPRPLGNLRVITAFSETASHQPETARLPSPLPRWVPGEVNRVDAKGVPWPQSGGPALRRGCRTTKAALPGPELQRALHVPGARSGARAENPTLLPREAVGGWVGGVHSFPGAGARPGPLLRAAAVCAC